MWYGKHGNKKCREILTESGNIGTAVHEFIKWDLTERKDEEVAVSLNMRQSVHNYLSFKKKYKLKPVLTEQTVYSLKYGYAGQLDLVAWVTDGKEDKLVLLDWKTSSGIYEDYQLQLEAYNNALREFKGLFFKGKVSKLPDELWVVRLDREKPIKYNIDIAKYTPHSSVFEVFVSLLKVFEWLNNRKEKKNDN